VSEYIPRLQESIASSIRGAGSEEMLHHPEGKWSATEILEHLYLSYTGTVKGCEMSLASGKPLVTPRTLKQRLQTCVVVTVGYYPSGVQAPERVRPRGVPVEQVVGSIAERIAAMDEAIGRCEARFGKSKKLLDHPVLGALTGDQWRKFHWLHGQHHVKQIVRLRGNFAGSGKHFQV
jgi:hypothetical protein